MNTKSILIASFIFGTLAIGAILLRPGGGSSVVATTAATLPAERNFTLDGSKGPVSLSDFPGKLVLLYFGYTSCPDICPTNLAMWSQALVKLSPDELARVRPIFISVDPERDTVERLAPYGLFFHSAIIALTGKPENLSAIAKRYGAVYSRYDDPKSGSYVIDHTAVTYVLDPQGQVVEKLPHGASSADLIAAIRKHLPKAR
jgi:protein SCO1/2